MYDENATYNPELQERALRLIMAHCPGQAANAADALRSRSDAGRQARLDRIIPIALRDAATWSIPDRELLARAMTGVPDGARPWLRAAFATWLDELDDAQLAALRENWANVMDDAALDRVDSWVIAGRAIAELRDQQASAS